MKIRKQYGVLQLEIISLIVIITLIVYWRYLLCHIFDHQLLNNLSTFVQGTLGILTTTIIGLAAYMLAVYAVHYSEREDAKTRYELLKPIASSVVSDLNDICFKLNKLFDYIVITDTFDKILNENTILRFKNCKDDEERISIFMQFYAPFWSQCIEMSLDLLNTIINIYNNSLYTPIILNTTSDDYSFKDSQYSKLTGEDFANLRNTQEYTLFNYYKITNYNIDFKNEKQISHILKIYEKFIKCIRYSQYDIPSQSGMIRYLLFMFALFGKITVDNNKFKLTPPELSINGLMFIESIVRILTSPALPYTWLCLIKHFDIDEMKDQSLIQHLIHTFTISGPLKNISKCLNRAYADYYNSLMSRNINELSNNCLKKSMDKPAQDFTSANIEDANNIKTIIPILKYIKTELDKQQKNDPDIDLLISVNISDDDIKGITSALQAKLAKTTFQNKWIKSALENIRDKITLKIEMTKIYRQIQGVKTALQHDAHPAINYKDIFEKYADLIKKYNLEHCTYKSQPGP